jgi:HD superfamily phosphodiesterase
MSSLTNQISFAEEKWLPSISDFLNELYRDVHLPSHDASHHFRVWGYCKELLYEIEKSGESLLSINIDDALIACAFHDTGLISNKSESHGSDSIKFCEQFLNKYPNLQVKNLMGILNAIELHDDKSLKAKDSNAISLPKLITTADDLDAFGLVGVFRYIEIYALRGISLDEIPSRVIDNVTNRFNSFQINFSFLDDYVAKQNLRFLVTKQFFIDLDQKVNFDNNAKGDLKPIAMHLAKGLLEEKLDVKSVIAYGIMNSHSAKEINFYMDLKDELNL